MKRRDQPEHRLQCSIVDHLRLRGLMPVAVPNGARIAGDAKQRAMRVALLKEAGMTPGFPDLIVFGPEGRVGTIEVKVGASRSLAQKECDAKLTSLGHQYALCRSIEEVEDTLVKWGWITPLRAPDGAKLRPAMPYIADMEAEAEE